MFGLGKSEEATPAPRILELTDLGGQPVLIETSSITSVHLHKGVTHVNTRDPITHKTLFFKVVETPLHIKKYLITK